MTEVRSDRDRLRRARDKRARRARPPKLIILLARSRLLETITRALMISLVLFGLALTGWGLFGEVHTFSTDLASLVDFAGGGDMLVAGTLDAFRGQVLQALGLAQPAPTEEILVPATGPGMAQTPGPGAGFVPYQVEIDGPTKEAPPIPGLQPPASRSYLPLVDNGAQAPAGSSGDEAQPTQAPTTQPAASSGASAQLAAPAASSGADAQPAASTGGIGQPAASSGEKGQLAASAASAAPAAPGWIVIPSINLDAPIIVSHTMLVKVDGKIFDQWQAPNAYAAGWQENSALLGQPGNTVLNGHHNIYGGVFSRLHELKQYDEIIVYSGDREYHYLVSQVMKVEERNASLDQRQENARWVMHSSDERLTLVTCWPPTSNTYRIIVVAVPVK